MIYLCLRNHGLIAVRMNTMACVLISCNDALQTIFATSALAIKRKTFPRVEIDVRTAILRGVFT